MGQQAGLNRSAKHQKELKSYMTQTLKPCPFCGSTDTAKHLTIGLKWAAGCNSCGCRTPEYSFSVDAVHSWNRRAADPQPDSDRDIDIDAEDQKDGFKRVGVVFSRCVNPCEGTPF